MQSVHPSMVIMGLTTDMSIDMIQRWNVIFELIISWLDTVCWLMCS